MSKGDTAAREAAITNGHCPECAHRGFVIGPRGGDALNIECGNLLCRARFNVSAYAGTILFAHVIPRESEGGARWPSAPKGH